MTTTRTLLLFYLFAAVAFATVTIPEPLPEVRNDGWHRATPMECGAEEKRELEWMGKAGWVGDPGISMGMSQITGGGGPNGKYESFSRTPCGYTNGLWFETRYVMEIGDKNGAREWSIAEDVYLALTGSKVSRYACDPECKEYPYKPSSFLR